MIDELEHVAVFTVHDTFAAIVGHLECSYVSAIFPSIPITFRGLQVQRLNRWKVIHLIDQLPAELASLAGVLECCTAPESITIMDLAL